MESPAGMVRPLPAPGEEFEAPGVELSNAYTLHQGVQDTEIAYVSNRQSKADKPNCPNTPNLSLIHI